MTFLQLEYFIEVASCMSFSKAAQNMFVSHQALSTQIKALEKELGMELFDRRNKRSLKLNESGKILLEAWTPIVEANKQAISRATAVAEEAEKIIRVGIQNVDQTRDAAFGFVNALMREKDFNAEFVVDAPSKLLYKLDNGEIDICCIMSFGENYAEKYKVIELEGKRTSPMIAVSLKNPLSKRKKITIKDLENETIVLLDEAYVPFARGYVENTFKEAGISSAPRIAAPLILWKNEKFDEDMSRGAKEIK